MPVGVVSAAPPRCDGERATTVGTPKRDVLRGTSGDDVIVSLAGHDTIDGPFTTQS